MADGKVGDRGATAAVRSQHRTAPDLRRRQQRSDGGHAEGDPGITGTSERQTCAGTLYL